MRETIVNDGRTYHKRRRIGSGTYGIVSLFQAKTGETIAVKTINIRDQALEDCRFEYKTNFDRGRYEERMKWMEAAMLERVAECKKEFDCAMQCCDNNHIIKMLEMIQPAREELKIPLLYDGVCHVFVLLKVCCQGV